MKKLLQGLLGCVVVMAVLPLRVSSQPEEATETVRAREIAFAQTMADRDFQAFRTFLSPEAVFFAPDGRALRGRDEVTEQWRSYFEGPEAPFSWEPDTTELLESGRLAFSSGPVYDADGSLIGRFNSVWRLDPDGVWRIVFDRGS